MKIKLNIDPDASGTEITITAPAMNDNITRLYKMLQNSDLPNQLAASKNNTSYYLNIDDILFFETDSKIVMAHTIDQAYQVKYKLYELEELLSGKFLRISKSTIINLDQVYSITRSISNCKIQFQQSYKTVYASRHYYRDLRDRLDERKEGKL